MNNCICHPVAKCNDCRNSIIKCYHKIEITPFKVPGIKNKLFDKIANAICYGVYWYKINDYVDVSIAIDKDQKCYMVKLLTRVGGYEHITENRNAGNNWISVEETVYEMIKKHMELLKNHIELTEQSIKGWYF